jgi:hypothetical protein
MTSMRWYSVKSSNLARIQYNKRWERLNVEFHDGSIYRYYDFPEEEFDALYSSGSKGKFLHRFIMDSYDYDRIN